MTIVLIILPYTPKFRKLKPDSILTLNLPEDYTHSNVPSTSSSSCRSRMELGKKTGDYNYIMLSLITIKY